VHTGLIHQEQLIRKGLREKATDTAHYSLQNNEDYDLLCFKDIPHPFASFICWIQEYPLHPEQVEWIKLSVAQ
jgi:hypothetical protein